MNATATQTIDHASTTEAASADAGEPGEPTNDSSSSSDNPDGDVPPEPTNVNSLIEVVDDRALTSAHPVDARRVAELLRLGIEHIDKPIARVSVRLIDEHQMQALHEQTLGDPVVTDVLSFDATELNQPVQADIAVCVDVAFNQSACRQHAIEQELLLYALHGLLHCCGYDDHDAAEYQRMHREEDRILAAIGIGPTFADHGDHTNRD